MFAKRNSLPKPFGKTWIKLIVLLFGIFMVTTKVTDADLLDMEAVIGNYFRSTTLDFSNRQTVNNYQLSTLFNIVGMLPGGFQVESLRIFKDGEMDLDYQVTSVQVGDSILCEVLDVKVMSDFKVIYDGKLNDMFLSSKTNGTAYDDLVLFLYLNESDPTVKNKTCNFNFVVQSTVQNTGFVDEEIIQNQVSSGTWSL